MAGAPDTACAPPPHVGIFWLVTVPGGAPVFVTDATPLAEAEPYGDCLGHARGHFEVWEAWQRLGVAGLARLGLPASIVDHDYAYFPRGRIVYRRESGLFVAYADPGLHTPRSRAVILARFHLDRAKVRFALDAHYRRP